MKKPNFQRVFAGISAAAVIFCGSAYLYAQQSGAQQPNDISSASSSYSSTSVFVGGTPIMRVRFGAAGYTPEQRAAAIQNRVNKLLGQGPIKPEDITVQDMDGLNSGVYVKGQLLFTADEATARYNQTPAHDLAEKWAATMRDVLPGLTKPTG